MDTYSITFNEFCDFVRNYVVANPNQRLGQATFNVLAVYRPDLSARIRRGGGLDPFYRDECLGKFYEFILKEW